MEDADCVRFLQWSLPRLRMQWRGFRRVRRQVCKRIRGRISELNLRDSTAYRHYLMGHPEEWPVLDACCRVTISRFYRDRAVFDSLHKDILPALAERTLAAEKEDLSCWSVGCASGEEAFTLRIIWNLSLRARFPGLVLRIVATDADAHMLERARNGCYGRGSLKELPSGWLEKAFRRSGRLFRIRKAFREGIEFCKQEIREQMPEDLFDLILCRNLVFTYFEPSLQREILEPLSQRLVPGGVLVIGKHESLPPGTAGLSSYSRNLGIYRRIDV